MRDVRRHDIVTKPGGIKNPESSDFPGAEVARGNSRRLKNLLSVVGKAAKAPDKQMEMMPAAMPVMPAHRMRPASRSQRGKFAPEWMRPILRGKAKPEEDASKDVGKIRDVNLDGRIDDIDKRVAELERDALKASREGNRARANDLLDQAKKLAGHANSLNMRNQVESGKPEAPAGKKPVWGEEARAAALEARRGGGGAKAEKGERPTGAAMPSQVRIVRKPRPGTQRQGAFNAPPRRYGVERPPNPDSPIASFDGARMKARRDDLGERPMPEKAWSDEARAAALAARRARAQRESRDPRTPAGERYMRMLERYADESKRPEFRGPRERDIRGQSLSTARGVVEAPKSMAEPIRSPHAGGFGGGGWVTLSDGRRIFIAGRGEKNYGVDGYMPESPEASNPGLYPYNLGKYNDEGRRDLLETPAQRQAHGQMGIWEKARVTIKGDE